MDKQHSRKNRIIGKTKIYDNPLLLPDDNEQYDSDVERFAISCEMPFATLCAECYKPIGANCRNKRFCDGKCSKRYSRRQPSHYKEPYVVICAECHKQIGNKKGDRNLCNGRCSGEYRIHLTEIKICANTTCGMSFIPRNRRQRFCCVYCSQKIQYKNRLDRRMKAMLTLIKKHEQTKLNNSK